MTIKSAAVICVSILFAACSSKPSASDIKRKVLLEYVCYETAKVNNLEVIEEKDAQALSGNEAYEYVVSGEVEWPSGCREFGTGIPVGGKEKFNKKSVFLVKTDKGDWQ